MYKNESAFQQNSRQKESPENTAGGALSQGYSSGPSHSLASVQLKKVNNTGLPDNLKSGIENLSGHSMDDVKVHFNSSKPAQFQAHAYTQGTDIHVASGQEKHLAHEAWHVVQQKQGRVQPTIQKHGVSINDNSGLENEADVMGDKALQFKADKSHDPGCACSSCVSGSVQMKRSNATAVQLKSGVIQLVAADLFGGTAGMSHLSDGSDAVGGRVSVSSDHAERKAWRGGKEKVKAAMKKDLDKKYSLQIDVDKGICIHCQMWMENILLGQLKNWDQQFGRQIPTELYIDVKLRGRPRVTRQVQKGHTDWSGISYSDTTARNISKDDAKKVKTDLYS